MEAERAAAAMEAVGTAAEARARAVAARAVAAKGAEKVGVETAVAATAVVTAVAAMVVVKVAVATAVVTGNSRARIQRRCKGTASMHACRARQKGASREVKPSQQQLAPASWQLT